MSRENPCLCLCYPPVIVLKCGPHLHWKFRSFQKTQGCHNVLASEQVRYVHTSYFCETETRLKRDVGGQSKYLQQSSIHIPFVRWFAILIWSWKYGDFLQLYLYCWSSWISTYWRLLFSGTSTIGELPSYHLSESIQRLHIFMAGQPTPM